MAQKVHQLALEIQGRLDGSLGNAIKTTQGQINELNDRVKTFREGQQKLRGSDVAYIQNTNSARELGKTLLDLKRTQSDISHLQERRKSTADLGRSFIQARREANALTAAYENDKSVKNKTAMQAAVKNSKALDKSYRKQREALKMVDERLRKAGVNTKKLSDEQKRLAGDIDKATKKQDEFNSKAEKIAQTKAHWEELRSSVARYATAAWRAAKWTAGITSALGYGAYRLAKSTAEAGDQAAKLGKKIRMSAEDVQKLQSVAGMSGVRDFSTAMRNMVKNTDLAIAGRGEAIKALQELRFKPKDFLSGGSTEALLGLSKRLQEIKSESARTRILQGLFGDQWAEMREMLVQGPDSIKKAMKEAEERGIISNDVASQSAEFMDNLQRAEETVKGLKNAIGSELLPIINETVIAATEWVKQNRELVSSEVRDWIKGLRERLPDIIDGFKKFGDGVGVVIDLFSKLIDLIGGAETAATGLAIYLGTKAFLGPIKALAGMGGMVAGAGGSATGATGGVVTGSGMLAAAAPFAAVSAAAWVAKNTGAFETPATAVETLSERRGLGEKPSESGLVWKALDEWWNGKTPENSEIAGDNIKAQTANAEIATQNMTANAENIQINGPAQPEITQGKARGGLVSTPTVTKLAERGAEIVVPLGGADRDRGIFHLNEAARKLGMQVSERGSLASRPPQSQITTNFSSEPPRSDRKTEHSAGMPPIKFAPTYHITGSDPEKTAQMVDAVTRSSFAEMIEEYFAGKGRLDFGTI